MAILKSSHSPPWLKPTWQVLGQVLPTEHAGRMQTLDNKEPSHCSTQPPILGAHSPISTHCPWQPFPTSLQSSSLYFECWCPGGSSAGATVLPHSLSNSALRTGKGTPLHSQESLLGIAGKPTLLPASKKGRQKFNPVQSLLHIYKTSWRQKKKRAKWGKRTAAWNVCQLFFQTSDNFCHPDLDSIYLDSTFIVALHHACSESLNNTSNLYNHFSIRFYYFSTSVLFKITQMSSNFSRHKLDKYRFTVFTESCMADLLSFPPGGKSSDNQNSHRKAQHHGRSRMTIGEVYSVISELQHRIFLTPAHRKQQLVPETICIPTAY